MLLLVAVMFMIWFERKVIGDMPEPHRAEPGRSVRPPPDAGRRHQAFFKEDIIPDRADRLVFRLAPVPGRCVPAFLTFAIVPLGGDFSAKHGGIIHIFGHSTLSSSPTRRSASCSCWRCRRSPSTASCSPAGRPARSTRCSARCGPRRRWSRYEAALGLSIASVFLVTGQLTTSGIVSAQHGWRWNIWVTGLVPFVMFFLASLAELNRPPFDLVEAEQELVGGFNTEYSSIRFAIFYLAEFMNAITMSAIVMTLFLGGPNGLVPARPDLDLGSRLVLRQAPRPALRLVWFRGTLPRSATTS